MAYFVPGIFRYAKRPLCEASSLRTMNLELVRFLDTIYKHPSMLRPITNARLRFQKTRVGKYMTVDNIVVSVIWAALVAVFMVWKEN